MCRYLYSFLIKIISGVILALVFIPSFVYLICSLIFDSHLNITTLILSISCTLVWIIFILIIRMVNTFAKKRIVFKEGQIQYMGRTLNMDNVSIKYFKFHVSVVEPSLVIPKLHISGDNLSVTCYLSRVDLNKLKKLNITIKEI